MDGRNLVSSGDDSFINIIAFNETLISVALMMRVYFFILFIFLASKVAAQDSTLTYNASILLSGANNDTPFWVRANQGGAIPLSGNFTVGQFGLYKVYNLHDPRVFQWSAGAELVTSYGKSANIFASDLYAAGKIGPVEVMAGQKRNITGLVDTLLTSGSLSVSGNSRPLPRVQISIPEFYPLAFTNYFVSIKASYSDGILPGTNINYGSIKYISRTYFHQKTIYFKLGNDNGRLTGFVGINHQAIWGGEDRIWPLYATKPLQAYWHTVTGKMLDRRRIGNHFGTVDMGIQWKDENWSYYLYRQSIYENGSLFKVINFTDGLNGLSIKRNKSKYTKTKQFDVHAILFEFLSTKNQTNDNLFSGMTVLEKGNYYNHYIYRNGWSYHNKNIGTPLVANKNDIKTDSYSSVSEFTNNNRILAFHTGLTASWLSFNFLFKGTYSRNFGTYISPFESRKDQISVLLSTEKKLSLKFHPVVFASLASDIGSLYPNSTSLMVGIKKMGFLN